MNDELDLIRRARAGDPGAFGLLVMNHQARLRAMAARYVADRDDVIDIVQDTFFEAYRSIRRFDPDREWGPWIRGICRNQVLNYLRDRRGRRRPAMALVDAAIESALPVTDTDPARDLERIEAMRKCIDQLQEGHREIVSERYLLGRPVLEIARRLARTPEAVSMMLGRIRRALMACAEAGGS